MCLALLVVSAAGAGDCKCGDGCPCAASGKACDCATGSEFCQTCPGGVCPTTTGTTATVFYPGQAISHRPLYRLTHPFNGRVIGRLMNFQPFGGRFTGWRY